LVEKYAMKVFAADVEEVAGLASGTVCLAKPGIKRRVMSAGSYRILNPYQYLYMP
jgi:hypothetical protein